MKYCSKCGAQIEDEAVICPQCGCDIGPKVIPDEGNILLGLVLGFFIGIIGLIIGLCSKKKKTKKGAVIGFFVGLAFSIISFVVQVIPLIQELSQA